MNRRQRRARGERGHTYIGAQPRIPGGCPDCNAYQTVDDTQAPVYLLTVHHDDTCPMYAQIRRTRHA